MVVEGPARAFEVEPHHEWEAVCACCGAPSTTLLGFIHEGSSTRAAYYLRFVGDDSSHPFSMALGVGAWGEGTTSADRVCACLEGRVGPDGTRIRIVDADATPWGRNEMLGRMLRHDEAIQPDIASEVFLLAEQIFGRDPRVDRALSESPRIATR